MSFHENIAEEFGFGGPVRPDPEGQKRIAAELDAIFPGPGVLPPSIYRMHGGLAGFSSVSNKNEFFALYRSGDTPDWLNSFTGDNTDLSGFNLFRAPADEKNAYALQEAIPSLKPRPLGTSPTFGFGDRTGFATPGHVAALQSEGTVMLPIFAQQSIREMERTGRSASRVMSDATWGAFQAGWDGPLGADADHLKTFGDVDYTAAAGFCFFTIDPSDHVDQRANDYSPAQLDEKFIALMDDGVEGADEFLKLYNGKRFDLDSGEVFYERAVLQRAAVKYGRALAHVRAMSRHIDRTMSPRPFEIELSVDETEQPTTVAEHLFIALELQRYGTRIVSLAPRFVGAFEKGIDYIGDADELARTMKQHAAIADKYGSYKLSLHSGSDKFSVYPILAEATGGKLHVKTAGTSYLEALRVVCRVDENRFREIVKFSRQCFETDRATYHISATLDGTPEPGDLDAETLERLYLDRDNGRQILHVTYGSVLTTEKFADAILQTLTRNPVLHIKVLESHLGNHLRLLRS